MAKEKSSVGWASVFHESSPATPYPSSMVYLPVPQSVTLYNGEINCHSLSLLLRAVVRKLGTCFMKYCSNGFRFPKAVQRKCFLVG